MRIEDFVVRIKYDYFVLILTKDSNVGFVAEIDYLLIHTILDENSDALRIAVWNKIHGSLNSIEVPGAIGTDCNFAGINRRRSFSSAEFPAIDSNNPFETAIRQSQHSWINLNIIGFVIFQKIVVRIDGCGVVADNHWVKMEPIGKATDDSQLIIIRSGKRSAGWRSRFCIGIGEAPRNVFVWDRRIRRRGRRSRLGRTRRDAQVQSINQTIIRCIVNANLS